MATPPQPDRAAAVSTAQGLTGALEGMTAELGRLSAFGKRSRHMIWGLIASLALDLVLTVFIAVTAIQAHDANTSATAARAVAGVAAQNSRSLCLSSNIARGQQIDLWNYVIGLSKTPPTAQEQEAIRKFRAHLDVIFAPRNCAHVAPGNP